MTPVKQSFDSTIKPQTQSLNSFKLLEAKACKTIKRISGKTQSIPFETLYQKQHGSNEQKLYRNCFQEISCNKGNQLKFDNSE